MRPELRFDHRTTALHSFAECCSLKPCALRAGFAQAGKEPVVEQDGCVVRDVRALAKEVSRQSQLHRDCAVLTHTKGVVFYLFFLGSSEQLVIVTQHIVTSPEDEVKPAAEEKKTGLKSRAPSCSQ